MKHAQANPSSAATNTNLIANAPGRVLIVRGVYVSSDTAMTITLSSAASHDAKWIQYVGANGGHLLGGTIEHELFVSDAGEGLDYSTSSNGNVFIKVMYGYADRLP